MERNRGREGGVARNAYLKAKEAYNASKVCNPNCHDSLVDSTDIEELTISTTKIS